MTTSAHNRYVLASSNNGKLAELAGKLQPLGIELTAQSHFNIEDADETGLTFVENALIKARHASAQSGLPALADDSGLVVPVLQGEPGIYSARYAMDASGQKPTDTDNIKKLLSLLESVPHEQRRARFVCVLACMQHADDPEPVIAVGHWHGTITDQPGGRLGFGYDPVFFCPATGMTAAEMPKEKKQSISHRARALAELELKLRTFHTTPGDNC